MNFKGLMKLLEKTKSKFSNYPDAQTHLKIAEQHLIVADREIDAAIASAELLEKAKRVRDM